jgi:hypothetical protein
MFCNNYEDSLPFDDVCVFACSFFDPSMKTCKLQPSKMQKLITATTRRQPFHSTFFTSTTTHRVSTLGFIQHQVRYAGHNKWSKIRHKV